MHSLLGSNFVSPKLRNNVHVLGNFEDVPDVDSLIRHLQPFDTQYDPTLQVVDHRTGNRLYSKTKFAIAGPLIDEQKMLKAFPTIHKGFKPSHIDVKAGQYTLCALGGRFVLKCNEKLTIGVIQPLPILLSDWPNM